MKVEVKKVDPIKRELNFVVPKERVRQKMEEVYQEISKNAKVKGFRQGKVPRTIIEQQHGRLAQQETIEKLIPEIYHEGITSEKISPIDLPEILDVSFKDGVITFKAVLEIKPEVELKEYKGIKVKRKSAEITEEELNKTLDYFKQGQGKDADVKIDDTFAKGLGYPNLDEFKSSLKRQLEIDKERHNRLDVENQIIEELLKRAKLTVPQSLVKKQLQRRIEDTKKRLHSQGIPAEEIAKSEEKMETDLKEAVEKDVKAYLIFDKIAQLENIAVGQNENLPAKVMEFLLKEAQWS